MHENGHHPDAAPGPDDLKEVQVPQGLLHRSQGGGRRAEWVLVGGQFDDTLGGQAEFARDFFDRSARLIDRQILERRVERQGQGHAKARRGFCSRPRVGR